MESESPSLPFSKTLNLINLVKERPLLWKMETKNDCTQKDVDRLWEEISKELKYPPWMLRAKFKYLSDKLCNELKRLEKDESQVNERTWAYLEHMTFLVEECEYAVFAGNIKTDVPTAPNSNPESAPETEQEKVFVNASDLKYVVPRVHETTAPASRQNPKAATSAKITRTFNMPIPSAEPTHMSSDDDDSDDDHFFDTVAETMRNLDVEKNKVFRLRAIDLTRSFADKKKSK